MGAGGDAGLLLLLLLLLEEEEEDKKCRWVFLLNVPDAAHLVLFVVDVGTNATDKDLDETA